MKRLIFPNSVKTSRMNVIVNLQGTLQNAAFGICYVLAMMDKRISLLVMRNSILKNVDYVVAHYRCLAKLVKFRKLTRCIVLLLSMRDVIIHSIIIVMPLQVVLEISPMFRNVLRDVLLVFVFSSKLIFRTYATRNDSL